MTREAGNGRGEVLSLLGTLGTLLLDFRVHAVPRGRAECCDGTLHTTHGVGKTHSLSPALTDCELSLLLSRDLFLANRFFFLCRGLDSRIISSNSKVGSQCRRPFCVETQGTEPCLWATHPHTPNSLGLPV